MALAMCPTCSDDEDIELIGLLEDGRREAHCARCDITWAHGEAAQNRTTSTHRTQRSLSELRGRLPAPTRSIRPSATGPNTSRPTS